MPSIKLTDVLNKAINPEEKGIEVTCGKNEATITANNIDMNITDHGTLKCLFTNSGNRYEIETSDTRQYSAENPEDLKDKVHNFLDRTAGM